MGSHESIVTIGMRGDGDMPMTPGQQHRAARADRGRSARDHRRTSRTSRPSETPQLWALYKEVQDYYDKGMRVPDDVTLLFATTTGATSAACRRAPIPRAPAASASTTTSTTSADRATTSGSTPIRSPASGSRCTSRHEYGANRIWIVNVGDLKPMEFPISFFLDYAWNPDRIPPKALDGYTQRWAAQQFRGGSALAPEIADVMTTTSSSPAAASPSCSTPSPTASTNFREFETRRRGSTTRCSAAPSESATALPPSYRRRVLRARANIRSTRTPTSPGCTSRRRAIGCTRSQGRARTNELADSVETLFERDAEITARYNTELAGGKWPHMMDQTHIGYTYWQEPPRNTMPRVDRIQLPVGADMGVSVVEQNRAPTGRGGGRPGRRPASRRASSLCRRSIHTRDRRFTSTSTIAAPTPFTYSAKASQPWVTITPTSGSVRGEQRLAVSVDWTRAPIGTTRVPITISGPNDAHVVVAGADRQSSVAAPRSRRRLRRDERLRRDRRRAFQSC